ncbi:hypothetical protein RQP46_003522 [Phenoliferia psychrophenolica]
MSAATHFENAPEDNVKRNTHRASYDRDVVLSIFKAAPVVHVGFQSLDGLPQVMPMMATIEVAEDDEVYVYLHGAQISRFIKTNKVGGTNLAITATVFDGYIFGLTPFSHSAQFRSTVIHGTVLPFLEDSDDTPDPMKDLANPELTSKIWTGVMTVALEPEPWKINQVTGAGQVPDNIANFSRDFAARSTAKMPTPPKKA